MVRSFSFALAFALSGCIVKPHERCHSCQIVTGTEPFAIRVRPTAKTLFIVVPGLLGYGHEWEKPEAAFKTAGPEIDFAVFWYRPDMSFDRAAAEFARVHNKTWASAPPSLERIVVVAHSGAGNLVARGADQLRVPPARRTTLATVGSPFAGMGVMGLDQDQMWRWPAQEIVLFKLRTYPVPAEGVDVIEYITENDPVTKRRGKHLPTDPRIGPAGAKRVVMPHGDDHDRVVWEAVEQLLAEVRR